MRRWSGLLGICLALSASPLWASEIPGDILQSAQKRIEYGLNPGIVIIFIEKDQPPVIQALGKTALKTTALPVTNQTPFEIGSLTKLFTALEASRLIETGQLKLEQSLGSLWPQAWGALDSSVKPIKLRALLSHSSGLPRLPDNFAPQNPADPYQDYSQTLLSQFMASYQLEKKPAEYNYSNFAYGLLGGLLPPLSGSPNYETMLKKNLLQPLGMHRSSTQDPQSPAILAQPHAAGMPVSPWHFSEVTAGAGALRSTGEDMARFVAAQISPPKTPLGQAILRSQQVLFKNQKETVAYGWHIYSHGRQTLYFHNGMTGGSQSFIGLNLKAGKGAAILTNNTDSVEDMGLRLLSQEFPLRPITDQRLSKEVLQAYIGQYELAPDVFFKVTQAAGYLIVQLTGQDALRVYPDQAVDTFDYRIVKAKLVFKRDEQGQVIGLTLHQGGQTPYAPRVISASDTDG